MNYLHCLKLLNQSASEAEIKFLKFYNDLPDIDRFQTAQDLEKLDDVERAFCHEVFFLLRPVWNPQPSDYEIYKPVSFHFYSEPFVFEGSPGYLAYIDTCGSETRLECEREVETFIKHMNLLIQYHKDLNQSVGPKTRTKWREFAKRDGIVPSFWIYETFDDSSPRLHYWGVSSTTEMNKYFAVYFASDGDTREEAEQEGREVAEECDLGSEVIFIDAGTERYDVNGNTIQSHRFWEN